MDEGRGGRRVLLQDVLNSERRRSKLSEKGATVEVLSLVQDKSGTSAARSS